MSCDSKRIKGKLHLQAVIGMVSVNNSTSKVPMEVLTVAIRFGIFFSGVECTWRG